MTGVLAVLVAMHIVQRALAVNLLCGLRVHVCQHIEDLLPERPAETGSVERGNEHRVEKQQRNLTKKNPTETDIREQTSHQSHETKRRRTIKKTPSRSVSLPNSPRIHELFNRHPLQAVLTAANLIFIHDAVEGLARPEEQHVIQGRFERVE